MTATFSAACRTTIIIPRAPAAQPPGMRIHFGFASVRAMKPWGWWGEEQGAKLPKDVPLTSLNFERTSSRE